MTKKIKTSITYLEANDEKKVIYKHRDHGLDNAVVHCLVVLKLPNEVCPNISGLAANCLWVSFIPIKDIERIHKCTVPLAFMVFLLFFFIGNTSS